jgi:peptidoglycan hydrolase CwlO-like protein
MPREVLQSLIVLILLIIIPHIIITIFETVATQRKLKTQFQKYRLEPITDDQNPKFNVEIILNRIKSAQKVEQEIKAYSEELAEIKLSLETLYQKIKKKYKERKILQTENFRTEKQFKFDQK